MIPQLISISSKAQLTKEIKTMKNELETLGDLSKILAKAELAKKLLNYLSKENTSEEI